MLDVGRLPPKPRPRYRHALPQLILAGAISVTATSAFADMLDDIGVRLLQSAQPTLNGAGITVAQAESGVVEDPPGSGHFVDENVFEVNPANAGVSSIPITYVNNSGQTFTTFSSASAGGSESGHADVVASQFYGSSGPSPDVAAVFNYSASYFLNTIISGNQSMPAAIANASFVFSEDTTTQTSIDEQIIDNYIANHGTIFVAAAGNGPNATPPMPTVQLPASSYNVIAVGALFISPGSTGTVTPAGSSRSKPDITAPGSATSFTAPLVSGIATDLYQAGSLGLGGAGTQAAADMPQTIKSLLLTGATKPNTWSNTTTAPLDPQLGAGIVNAFGSYKVLAGREQTFASSNSVALGGSHDAITSGPFVSDFGWNFRSGLTTSSTTDSVDHYLLNLPLTGKAFSLTATLVWDRPFNATQVTGINNLDLFLYNTASPSTPITMSVSTVDNVEQIYLPALAPGSYDLEVLKHGGFTGTPNVLSNSEDYALSWAAPLLGDANWDGVVDLQDLSIVTNHWQSNQRSWFNGDLNGDGVVDLGDLSVVTNNWQSTIGQTSNASTALSLAASSAGNSDLGLSGMGSQVVPEPAALCPLAIGSVALLRRRRRVIGTAAMLRKS